MEGGRNVYEAKTGNAQLRGCPVDSDKALAPWLCRKRILTKMESSETSKLFIRRKKKQRVQQVWIDTWAESEGETLSHPLVVA